MKHDWQRRLNGVENPIWNKLREDIPACANSTYLNNAGASPTHSQTHNTMVDYLALERSLGGYHAAIENEQALNAFYQHAATLLNTAPSEISFCENATRAWAMAFYAIPLQRGDRVITHISEYSSNLMAMQHRAQRDGITIDFAPSLADGTIDTEALESLITPNTKIIAITHVAMHLGRANPIERVGHIAQKYNLLYLLDACQSIGQRVLDVNAIGCHVLTATGRKYLRGPRGTGLLYVSHGILHQLSPVFVDNLSAQWQADGSFTLATDAKRFESWERNVAGMLGLSCTIKQTLTLGVSKIQNRITTLAEYFSYRLNDTPFQAFEVPSSERDNSPVTGICTLNLSKNDGHDDHQKISKQLNQHSVLHSIVQQHQAYPYFEQRDMRDTGIVRLSFHAFNNESDIEAVIAALTINH